MARQKNELSKELMNQIGSNIMNKRISLGLSQTELASLVSNELGLTETLSNLAISTYERGDRCPPISTLIALANVFNITLNELVGNPTRKKGNYNIKTPGGVEHEKTIRPEDYALYDKKPVWMEARNHKIEGRWGILDYKGNDNNIYFVCTEGRAVVDSSVVLFASSAIDAINMSDNTMTRLNISDLPEHEFIYVISTSHDDYVKSLYTGYYKCDTDHMIIINRSNGLALPFSGLGISYQAFA